MENRILIAGGAGLIGSRLTKHLQNRGYTVFWLSRNPDKPTMVKTFFWDPEKNLIDDEAILQADYIINLAGTNVFGKKWTGDYKKSIVESRIRSANVLLGKTKILEQPVKAYISASGVGYYGLNTGEKLVDENTQGGTDFLADVVKQWEKAADQFEKIKIRTVKIRTSIALSEEGGPLEKLMGPINAGIGAPLGSGKQYFPWIHIDDLCNVYIKAIEDDQMKGVYNAVAPDIVTNKELTKKTAHILHKPTIMPNVPAFILKLMMGTERAEVLLGGQKVSCKKLQDSGFSFQYPELDTALKNILNNKITA
ncbi:MAG: TIGR01777 family oxidoreductase [Cytophagaceae bacterium]